MASNPLENAINALVETLKTVSSHVGARGLFGATTGAGTSPVGGVSTGTTFLTGITRTFGDILPVKLRIFGEEVQKTADLLRNARLFISSANEVRTTPGIGSTAFGLKEIGKLSKNEALSKNERSIIADAIENSVEAKKKLDEYVSVRNDARAQFNQSVNAWRVARQANIAEQAKATKYGPMAAMMGVNVARTTKDEAEAFARFRAARTLFGQSQSAVSAAAVAAGNASSGVQSIGASAATVIAMRNFTSFLTGSYAAGVAFIAALTSSGYIARSFAENINSSNISLMRFSPQLSVAMSQIAFGKVGREFRMAELNTESSVRLAKTVDNMREAWFNYDVASREITNKLGTEAARFGSGFGNEAGKIAEGINRRLEQLGFGAEAAAGEKTTAETMGENAVRVAAMAANTMTFGLFGLITGYWGLGGDKNKPAGGFVGPPGQAGMIGDNFALAMAGKFGKAVPVRQGFGDNLRPNAW